MPEQTPNLWTVVESQQNLSQPAQPEQPKVEAALAQQLRYLNIVS